MQATKYVETVGKDGVLHLKIGKPMGAKVEVIVLELDEQMPNEALALAKL